MSVDWYTLGLVDVNGNGLTQNGLALADDRKLTLQQAGAAPDLFSFTLPTRCLETQAIQTGRAYVKVYRRKAGATAKELVFYGQVWGRELQGAQRRMAFTALDPSWILAKRDTGMNATSDQGAILKSMIDLTNSLDGETGIRTNSANIVTSATATVELARQVPMISTVVQQFASQLDGCEAWVTPIELEGGKICDFHAAPSRGILRPNVVFGFGEGSLANCVDMGMNENLDRVENDLLGFSDTLEYRAIDLTSVAAHRRLKGNVSMTGETTLLRLTSRTLGRLSERNTPVAAAEWSAQPGPRAPRIFDDWMPGDTVTLDYDDTDASGLGLHLITQQKAVSADISIARNGRGVLSAVRFRSAA